MTESPAPKIFRCAVNGVGLRVYEHGAGDPLLLIHGQFGDYLDWEPLLEPLAARHRVIALDLPGFGDSEKPDRDYSAELFVRSLQGVLAELGVLRVTPVGISFGGQLALYFALAHPEKVSRLVLINSGGFHPWSDAEKQMARTRASAESIAGWTPEIISPLFGTIFALPSEFRDRYLAKQAAKISRTDYLDYARAVSRAVELAVNTFLLERVSEITCPVLLLWGEKDTIIPVAQAQRALEKFPHAQLTTLAHAGHMLPMDAPEHCVRAIEEFLEAHPEFERGAA
jgi:pimeloyl-ACP methyl ester carboxylesterase